MSEPTITPPSSANNSLTIPVTLDPRTGDPTPTATAPATDPAGVWASDVQGAPGIQAVPPPTGTPTPPAPSVPADQPFVEIEGRRYYTQDYLEQARSQEREKMHQRLESLEQRLAREDAEREQREKQIREEAEAAAREAEAQRLATLPLEEKVNEIQQMWERRWQERDAQDQAREALEAQERRFNDLMAYRARRIAEESNLIHPTLVDMVASPETGAATEEQIEASITALKAKTDAIVGTVQAAQVTQRAAMPSVAPTGTPPVGPMDATSGYQTISPADIAAMDAAQYAKNRPALMEALRRQRAERGLYG